MQAMNFLFESWNVRGLGDLVKCSIVQADVAASLPHILALQESKLTDVSSAKAASFLPPFLRCFEAVDAVGSAGGIVTAWNGCVFNRVTSQSSQHILSVDLVSLADASSFHFTNVYAPCSHAEKEAFLLSLRTHDLGDSVPWIICGDFNLCRSLDDRNNANLNQSKAALFNDCIHDFALIELPLRDRRYTWSNRRSEPTLIRHDRFFLNNTANSLFPSSSLSSFSRDISDHVPIIATVSSAVP